MHLRARQLSTAFAAIAVAAFVAVPASGAATTAPTRAEQDAALERVEAASGGQFDASQLDEDERELIATTLVGKAGAQPSFGPVDATISKVDLADFPLVRVQFSADEVDGRLPDLVISENGREISSAQLYRGEVGSFEDRAGSDIMIVLDTSLSMKSPRIDDAVSAAGALIDRARKGDRIGIATFGGDAEVLLKPTADLEKVRGTLAEVKLAERTTMFDAVRLAARSFDEDRDARRAIVVLSDGADVGSEYSATDATNAANKVGATIWPVSIQPPGAATPRHMAALAAGGDGVVRTVSVTGELEEMFDELGRQLLQSYWTEFRSQARSGQDVAITIGAADAIGGPGAWKYTAPALPTGSDGKPVTYTEPKPLAAKKPLVPMPSGPLGVLLAALPFALIFFFLAYSSLQRRSRPDLVARIEQYTARRTSVVAQKTSNEDSLLRNLSQPFVKIAESMLGRTAFFARIRFMAEQANIAIKPAELFAMMLGAAGFGGFIGLLFAKPLLMIVLSFAFGAAPYLWLKMKAKKRRKHFEDQLADVLGGISSSLKAGHSFNQAINAIIKDTPNPTAEEFQRVMTEARLGLPIEMALQAMADRMGSPDFDFAVTTVNIQRTVGGSLADILEMVGDTVRNRQQFRKKVKALTSMGQMSAYVLLGMPIFIALVLTLMSPQYIQPLFFTRIGHFMLGAACTSMALGYFACMKIVNVKV